jgi:hypothetical protein
MATLGLTTVIAATHAAAAITAVRRRTLLIMTYLPLFAPRAHAPTEITDHSEGPQAKHHQPNDGEPVDQRSVTTTATEQLW